MFDRILVVDWSASNAPTRGNDSIWIADADGAEAIRLENHPTRAAAAAFIERAIAQTLADGRRIFVGLDFAFGYPIGSTQLPGEGAWEAVWSALADRIEDDDSNRSNRFDVAGGLNAAFAGEGPFWGYPNQHHDRYAHLPFRRPDYERLGVRERRVIDTLSKASSPVWKLSGAGAVGSQSLVGIPRLQQLRERFGADLQVWPFETRFAENVTAPAVVAEIYPSLWPHDETLHDVRDACQVGTLARGFAKYREDGRFADLLAGPSYPAMLEAALGYEAWMVGFADEVLPL